MYYNKIESDIKREIMEKAINVGGIKFIAQTDSNDE
jgi:hypothetical protein